MYRHPQGRVSSRGCLRKRARRRQPLRQERNHHCSSSRPHRPHRRLQKELTRSTFGAVMRDAFEENAIGELLPISRLASAMRALERKAEHSLLVELLEELAPKEEGMLTRGEFMELLRMDERHRRKALFMRLIFGCPDGVREVLCIPPLWEEGSTPEIRARQKWYSRVAYDLAESMVLERGELKVSKWEDLQEVAARASLTWPMVGDMAGSPMRVHICANDVMTHRGEGGMPVRESCCWLTFENVPDSIGTPDTVAGALHDASLYKPELLQAGCAKMRAMLQASKAAKEAAERAAAAAVQAEAEALAALDGPLAPETVEIWQPDAEEPGSVPPMLFGDAEAPAEAPVPALDLAAAMGFMSSFTSSVGGEEQVGPVIPEVPLTAERDVIFAEDGPLGMKVMDGPDGGTIVSRVIEGTQAERLNVRAGSQILKVNGEHVAGLARSEVVGRIAAAGRPVSVSLFCNDEMAAAWAAVQADLPPPTVKAEDARTQEQIEADQLAAALAQSAAEAEAAQQSAWPSPSAATFRPEGAEESKQQEEKQPSTTQTPFSNFFGGLFGNADAPSMAPADAEPEPGELNPWVCGVCSHLHEGDEAASLECSVCGNARPWQTHMREGDEVYEVTFAEEGPLGMKLIDKYVDDVDRTVDGPGGCTMVADVIDGTMAAELGVMPGSQITKVNGLSVEGQLRSDVVKLMQAEGRPLTLTLFCSKEVIEAWAKYQTDLAAAKLAAATRLQSQARGNLARAEAAAKAAEKAAVEAARLKAAEEAAAAAAAAARAAEQEAARIAAEKAAAEAAAAQAAEDAAAAQARAAAATRLQSRARGNQARKQVKDVKSAKEAAAMRAADEAAIAAARAAEIAAEAKAAEEVAAAMAAWEAENVRRAAEEAEAARAAEEEAAARAAEEAAEARAAEEAAAKAAAEAAAQQAAAKAAEEQAARVKAAQEAAAAKKAAEEAAAKKAAEEAAAAKAAEEAAAAKAKKDAAANAYITNAGRSSEYTVTFTEAGSLGIKLTESLDGGTMVGDVLDGSTASKLGVLPGSQVLEVNGQGVAGQSKSVVTNAIALAGRPLTLKLFGTEEMAKAWLKVRADASAAAKARDAGKEAAAKKEAEEKAAAIARGEIPPNTRVLVKRSNGEETLGYITNYNAAEKLYKVELHPKGSKVFKNALPKMLRVPEESEIPAFAKAAEEQFQAEKAARKQRGKDPLKEKAADLTKTGKFDKTMGPGLDKTMGPGLDRTMGPGALDKTMGPGLIRQGDLVWTRQR